MAARAVASAGAVAAVVVATAAQPSPAAAADCAPGQVVAKVTQITANDTDDAYDADEVHVVATAKASNGLTGNLVAPRVDVAQSQTVAVAPENQVMFNGVVGPTDSVAIQFAAWDLDQNYLDRVPAELRGKIDEQLQIQALALNPYAIAAYVAKLGYGYLAEPDQLAAYDFSVPACGPATETWSKYFKVKAFWGPVSKYTFHFQVDRIPTAGSCNGVTATITGTDAGEVLRGTPGRDVIDARGGNDTIESLGGDDLICAGAGDDKVSAGDGNDTITSGDGNDTSNGNAGDDRVEGGAGSDSLYGGKGSDLIFGFDGADTIYGGLGADVLYGELGPDRIFHSNGTDDDGVRDHVDGGTDGGSCQYTNLDTSAGCTARL